MDNIGLSFGKILKKYRLKSGLSQEKLALISKIDRTYISLLERGKRTPSINIVFKLANAMDVLPHVIIKDLELLIEKQN